MGVKLVSSGGGSVEINPPATASNFTATMPAGTGNVVVNGVNGVLVSATAVASTSGTSIDFTSIPSWVKRITVMFSGVSTNGSSLPRVQLGSGSITTSGYIGSATSFASSTLATTNETGGFVYFSNSATYAINGVLNIINFSGNTWICSGTGDYGTVIPGTMLVSGRVTLGGTLDRIRITTINGTDTFDAGSINIMYE